MVTAEVRALALELGGTAAQTHGCGAVTALSGLDSANKQSVSQERQRYLRDSPANLSLTSLEREEGSKLDLYLCF